MGNKSSPFCTFLQDRVCEAQRSNESPSGAFKRQRGLRQQMEGRCPDKLDGICSKAVIVGLILNIRQETISISHIVMFAEKTYNAFEPVGHTKRRKERENHEKTVPFGR